MLGSKVILSLAIFLWLTACASYSVYRARMLMQTVAMGFCCKSKKFNLNFFLTSWPRPPPPPKRHYDVKRTKIVWRCPLNQLRSMMASIAW